MSVFVWPGLVVALMLVTAWACDRRTHGTPNTRHRRVRPVDARADDAWARSRILGSGGIGGGCGRGGSF